MPSFSLPEVLNCLFLLFFSYAVCLSDIFQFKKKTLPQGGVAVRVESGSREPSCMLWEMAFIIKATPHFISRSVPTMCGNHPPNPKFRSNSSDSCLLQDLEGCLLWPPVEEFHILKAGFCFTSYQWQSGGDNLSWLILYPMHFIHSFNKHCILGAGERVVDITHEVCILLEFSFEQTGREAANKPASPCLTAMLPSIQ